MPRQCHRTLHVQPVVSLYTFVACSLITASLSPWSRGGDLETRGHSVYIRVYMAGTDPLIRTILVDDDIAMLKGLQTIVSWEDEGFEIVGTAENGRDALRLVDSEAVDLMICDITMPGLDGLALTKEAKAVSPGIKSIILTCHDEFPFAREAVAVRADDYLVKYTLTKEELSESLLRVKQQIEAEHSSHSQVVRAQRAMEESQHALLRRFAGELLAGDPAEKLESRAFLLDLRMPPAKFVAVGFFFDGHRNSEGNSESHYFEVEAAFRELNQATMLPLQDDVDLLLYWGYHTREQAAKELRPLFDGLITPPVTIALADGFTNVSELRNAVEALKQLAEGAFYMPRGSIIIDSPHFSDDEAWELFAPIRGDLRTTLNTRDQTTAEQLIGRLFDTFDQVRPVPAGVRGVAESILIDIGFVANDAKIPFHIDFLSFARLGGYRAHLLETARAFFTALDAATVHTSRNDIEKIKAYIDNHLSEPIGLDTICELVYMNKSYLSRLFKQETGETFSEYLMRRRVEKAKRMLQASDKSIDEITEAIGLENSNHFYRIFKKVTGTTPGAFRK